MDLKYKLKNIDLVINTTPIGMSSLGKTKSSSREMPLGDEIWQNLNSKFFLSNIVFK